MKTISFLRLLLALKGSFWMEGNLERQTSELLLTKVCRMSPRPEPKPCQAINITMPYAVVDDEVLPL